VLCWHAECKLKHTEHIGGSAFAGYQPFSPSLGEPLLSGSHPQAKGEEEEGSPIGDEDMQVNNRVAGGAGKRLSVEDLQVHTDCHCTLTLLHKASAQKREKTKRLRLSGSI